MGMWKKKTLRGGIRRVLVELMVIAKIVKISTKYTLL